MCNSEILCLCPVEPTTGIPMSKRGHVGHAPTCHPRIQDAEIERRVSLWYVLTCFHNICSCTVVDSNWKPKQTLPSWRHGDTFMPHQHKYWITQVAMESLFVAHSHIECDFASCCISELCSSQIFKPHLKYITNAEVKEQSTSPVISYTLGGIFERSSSGHMFGGSTYNS